jgi:hypothetical protein
MSSDFTLRDFLAALFAKDERAILSFFQPDALVYLHCTNECLTAEEYARSCTLYPGAWDGEIEYELHIGEWEADRFIFVVRVYSVSGPGSFHVCCSMQLHGGKIVRIDEYWNADYPAPPWRKAQGLGRPIR